MDKDTSCNGLVFINKYFIPPEILTLILSYVDEKTLCKHCPLVCKLWNEYIQDFVWKMKCEEQFLNKHQAHSLRQKQFASNVYQMICVFKNSFYKNLIKNPCGTDGFNHWMIDKNGGDRFIIEDCGLLDRAFCEVNDSMMLDNPEKCFTTSYDTCSKFQIIDLHKTCGFTQQFIDEYQPPIFVSEWYGSRRDCGCVYRLHVILFDSDFKPIRRCNCNFLFHYTIDQWQGGFFEKVEYILKNYGTNVRYIFFYHIGKDTQFWAGHYGSKFTSANVEIFYPYDTSKDEVNNVHSNNNYDIHQYCKQIDQCQSPLYNFDRALSSTIKKYKHKHLK